MIDVKTTFFNTSGGVWILHSIPWGSGTPDKRMEHDIWVNLTKRYPQLAEQADRGNYSDIDLFCKLQGYRRVKR